MNATPTVIAAMNDTIVGLLLDGQTMCGLTPARIVELMHAAGFPDWTEADYDAILAGDRVVTFAEAISIIAEFGTADQQYHAGALLGFLARGN